MPRHNDCSKTLRGSVRACVTFAATIVLFSACDAEGPATPLAPSERILTALTASAEPQWDGDAVSFTDDAGNLVHIALHWEPYGVDEERLMHIDTWSNGIYIGREALHWNPGPNDTPDERSTLTPDYKDWVRVDRDLEIVSTSTNWGGGGGDQTGPGGPSIEPNSSQCHAETHNVQRSGVEAIGSGVAIFLTARRGVTSGGGGAVQRNLSWRAINDGVRVSLAAFWVTLTNLQMDTHRLNQCLAGEGPWA